MHPPAGWHPDPYNPALDRWWDGQKWTDQTRTRGQSFPTPTTPVGSTALPPQPRPQHAGSGSKKKWPWAAGAVALLVLLGSCIGDDEPSDSPSRASTPTSTPTAKDLNTAPILTGTITEVDSPHVRVDVGVKYPIKIMLAQVGPGSCSGMSAAYGKRLVESLPVGASVTLVRMPDDAASTKMGDTAFIHLAEPGKTATETPYGRSINETIVASGDGVFLPEIEHYRNSPPVEAQIPALMVEVPQQAEAYADALIAADVAAWDQRLGGVAACRAAQEQRDREHDDYMREHYGPDLLPDTEDDPDRNVNLPNADLPSSGGSSGGGGFCRHSRFC